VFEVGDVIEVGLRARRGVEAELVLVGATGERIVACSAVEGVLPSIARQLVPPPSPLSWSLPSLPLSVSFPSPPEIVSLPFLPSILLFLSSPLSMSGPFVGLVLSAMVMIPWIVGLNVLAPLLLGTSLVTDAVVPSVLQICHPPAEVRAVK